MADGAGDDLHLITSDPDDITALLAHADHPARVIVLPSSQSARQPGDSFFVEDPGQNAT